MHFTRIHKFFVGSLVATGVFCIAYMSYGQKYELRPEQENLQPAQKILAFPHPVRGAKNIILLETSCVVNQTAYTSLQVKLNSQQACAVESAAKTNPRASVYLFHSCPLDSASLERSSQMVQRVFRYPNAHVWHQSMDSVFKGTPLEELYGSGKMNKSAYPVSHASDVLRFLMLWKYGGIYLDLDFVVMRPLETLDPNFAGVECCDYLGSSVLAFTTEGIGKKMADTCVDELRTDFRGDIFNHNGPALITRVLRAQCGINSTDLMTREACGGFNVLPTVVFYPIGYGWRPLYNESRSDATMKDIRRGHGIHLWNTQMVWQGGSLSLLRPGSRQPLVLLEQEFCPAVYEETAAAYVASSIPTEANIIVAVSPATHVASATAPQANIIVAVSPAAHVASATSPQANIIAAVAPAAHVASSTSPRANIIVAVSPAARVASATSPRANIIVAVSPAAHVASATSAQANIIAAVSTAAYVASATSPQANLKVAVSPAAG